ncbi:MAG: hypothetical protein ACYTBJ_07410 [Planctomycetota bacterium]|jgi:hypothetical protein
MEPTRTKSQWFSLNSLALAAIILAGLYLGRSALKSSRPSVSKPEQVAFQREKIDCRLWQDPIRAVRAARESKAWPKNPISCVRKEIKYRIEKSCTDEPDGPQVQVLLVMVRSGDSAEDYEDRLRHRQAVLAALRKLNFEPEDCEHICYFEVDIGTPNKPNTKEPNASPPEPNMPIVPYEWFQRDKLHTTNAEVSAQHVLVLWLQDEYFGDTPLAKLKRLIRRLRTEYTCDGGENKRLTFDVIGPRGSAALHTMLQEEITHKPNGPNIPMYSPWSTVAPDILMYNLANAPKDKSIRSILKKKGFDLVRTIGTDDLLADCLIEELSRRRVDISDSDTQVALICEWDSLYGRVFPETLEVVRCRRKFPQDKRDYETLLDNARKYSKQLDNLQVFAYMRGIDGKLPAQNSLDRVQSAEKAPARRQPTFSEAPEFPTGSSQADYIRRLARNLAEKYQHPGRKDRLKAIGILGSDVYDKLILLQALRQEFSDVIFFTTDLDARLMHHSNFKWTRNLIVASNYGLALNERYQPLTLRFRDNYQTSQYLACLMALGFSTRSEKLLRELPESQLENAFTPPRLFEIGRDCAVNLTVEAQTSETRLNFHPTVPTKDPANKARARHYLLWIGVAAGIVLLLLAYLSQSLRKVIFAFFSLQKAESEGKRYIGLIKRVILGLLAAGSVLSVAVFIRTVYKNHFWPEGEPFSFEKGVSIWPGEALRLVAGILSLFFIIKSLYDLNVNQEDIKDEFLGESSEGKKTAGKACETLVKWYAENHSMLFRKVTGRSKPEELWNQYSRRGCLRHRFIRVIPALLFYGLLAPTLIWKGCGTLGKWYAENVSLSFWKITPTIKAEELWRQYGRRGRLHHRLIRIIPALLLYALLGLTLMFTFGFPNCPCRGHPSLVVDRILLALAIPSMLLLIFFVVDATQLCVRFIENLKKPTDWSTAKIMRRLKDNEEKRLEKSPPEELQETQKAQDRPGRQIEKMADEFDEWLDIKLIARRTQAVGKLIYYPFIVLLIMLVSRSRFFDNWNWPIGLIVIFTLNTSFALYCAIRMRRSAEKARREAIEKLQEQLIRVQGRPGGRAEKIRTMIEQIRSIKQGAFSPFSENPVIGAILIPSGGMTLLALLEVFAKT